MSKAAELAEALKALTRKPTVNLVCKVLEVTGKTCRVEPIDGGAEITGVRLSPVTDSSNEGILIVPEVGSYVMVSQIKVNAADFVYYVSSCSRITEFKMITTSGTVYSLAKTEMLVTELNKTNTLINALLAIINGAPIPEAGNGAPSALQTALKAALVGQSLGNYANIKNEKIKHNG
jgi:hypothetical protein